MSTMLALSAPSWLTESSYGKLIGIGLVALAAGLLAFGVLVLLVKRQSAVDVALKPYSASPHAAAEDHDGATPSFVQTALLRRAVSLTARLAAYNGLLEKVEADLERADLPIRAPEVLLFSVVGSFIAAALALAAEKSAVAAVLALIVVAVLPIAVIRVLGSRNRQRFISQLPDTLNLLAGSLRSGFSFVQGVETVSTQLDGPMGRELRRIVAEGRLGRPLEDSMEETASRMESEDFDWVVMAVRVQREVGGNLAEVLTSVADTMVQRDRLRREIKALTAEGRISVVILGIMPVALGLFLYVVNPDYIKVLFEDKVGRMMAVGAAVLAVFGIYWMRKTTEIEL